MEPIWDQRAYQERARDYLHRIELACTGFSGGLREPLKVTPGTYVLFNQVTRLLVRARDLHLILRRMFENREQLHGLDLITRDIPQIVGHEAPRWKEKQHLENAIRIDFEALYLFGNVALDLWAAVSSHVLGRRRAHSFDDLRELMTAPATAPAETIALLEPMTEDILWLAALVRFYRNRFLVHVTRPWQISWGRSEAYDFNLASTIGGHVDTTALAMEVTRLSEQVPIALPRTHMPQQTLYELLMSIGSIADRSVRFRILRLYGQYGARTPSFHVVGDRLLGFLATATERTLDAALSNPLRVVLGRASDATGASDTQAEPE